MSKFHINTKSSSYIKDKEVFLRELKQFNESKNLPFKTPVVNGVDIDLYLFYSLVQQKGGVSKVNQTDTWDTFLRPLHLPHPCINGSTLLKKLYGTYLEKYERAKGPPGRDDDNDMDDDPRRTRSGVPRGNHGSGTYFTASGEALRTGTRGVGPGERLALSLLSPLPNEQDFAVNVCSVLAADLANRLPLATSPHILDFLLAHAGVYNHPSLRDTIGRSYLESRGRAPHEFWRLRAGGGGARELQDEPAFAASAEPALAAQALAAHRALTDALAGDKPQIPDLVEDWVSEPTDEDQLFAPELAGGASCVFTQRVLQVASIVRSLSFHDENLPHLAKNTTLIRFLLLCANCWVGSLRQSGLDTLGNISTELIIKDPATCLITRHVLSTIQSALASPDRARVLAALELLNKLAQNEANEDALLRSLEAKVYLDVCSLLGLRDIMVLVMSLECVYALTSLGERAAEHVARAPGLVPTLLALVTVEAQSYGPRACVLMRVVETVSAAPEREERPAAPPPPPPAPGRPPAPASPAPQPPPLTTIQQSHAQQRTAQENENFALAWLRSSYEPLPAGDNSASDAGVLYRQYVAACAKLNRKALPTPHVARLVRTVFGGTVGPNTVTISTGETQQVYVGIRSRNPQNRTTPATGGPASPILKAQLTNKPPAVEVKPVVNQVQPQQPPLVAHPHLSQALESNPSNTTLIKHLLAHKVSPAPTQMQVAQRQNQQRIGGNAPATVVVQANQGAAMEVDPEALIKCSTITPGGVASSTPSMQGDKVIVNAPEDGLLIPKEESVQIQLDEQTQLTLKSAQNKMLADLLEKKSNPPVQVVQMSSQLNAPTIQITETGQIVQVKPDTNPVIQINEAGVVTQSSPYFQIKNEQGQIIQIKNEQGQVIQLKSDQLQPVIQFKNEVHIKEENVTAEHSYTEPPAKKIKVEDKKDTVPHESVSKTAANLYAALAASALEDEEDLMPPKQEEAIQQPVLVAASGDNQPVMIQEPILQVQQPTMQVQQPTLQVQQPTLQVQGSTIQVQQPTLQVQQPMLQVQPMDVQNIIASQAGQLILQEKPIATQQTQFVQQPMQLIATPGNPQGGLSYIAQNIPGNMMQKTIIIVQGPTGGGPLTLTVNNPAGLDEATLNNLIAQATEAITQQQIIQNTPQLTPSQQPLITTQPQPHKAQIVNQQQIVVTPKQAPALIQTSTGNIQGGSQIISVPNQQIIMNTPKGMHRVVQQRANVVTSVAEKPAAQATVKPQQPVMRQVITRQPIMVGNTKIGDKETVVTQPVVESKPAPLVPGAADDTPWICHWRGCGKVWSSCPEVFRHAARAHCPAGANAEAPCQWLDCDRVPRRTFALLNHLTDKHCTPQALKAIHNARRHAAAESEANKPVSVVYPPNAALAALNKHATDMFNPRELMDENEGPVTKSIRLTAALILRNIVIYSNTGRRHLRSYESHLSSIALSNVEASRTIAQVLYDMNNI